MDIYFEGLAEDIYARRALTLIDVGARGGLQPNWLQARRHLRLVGFEPDPTEHARLTGAADAGRTIYINAALGREAREVSLRLGREAGTSSLLPANMEFLRRFPRPERYDVVEEVRINVDRLDALLARYGIADPDFLKIDTQGGELAILEGSQDALANSIFGVEIEVQFAPLYLGQPSFGELDDLLRARGFHLFDLRPSYWKRAAGASYGGPKGQLAFGDALYLKTEAALKTQLQAALAREHDASSKLLRALSVCLLYGYRDYAIELLSENSVLLDASMAHSIDAQLRSDIRLSTRLPHFRGRGWLSHLFYRLHRALYPTVGGWASGGRHLGNVE